MTWIGILHFHLDSTLIRFLLAKSLQLGGITLAGLALVTGLEGSMRQEVIILLLAIGIFTSGWFIQDTDGE